MAEDKDQPDSPEEGHVALSVWSSYETLPEATDEDERLLPTSSRPASPPSRLPQYSNKGSWIASLRFPALILLAVLATVGFFWAWPSTSTTFSPAAVSNHTWPLPLQRAGSHPFFSSSFDPALPTLPLTETLTTKSFSEACAEEYIAFGTLCAESQGQLSDPRIDVVYTWTNGSNVELMTRWREAVSAQIGIRERLGRLLKRVSGASVVRHFRDHDELRHSIRSVVSAFTPGALAKVHLVVGDTPACTPTFANASDFDFPHEAQVPHWLDLEKVVFPTSDAANFTQEDTDLVVHPHSEIFKKPTSRAEEAKKWRAETVPSFNSFAIESQLANLAGLGDATLSMNDDFFVLRNLSTTDLVSPLTGPVFRLQRDLHVNGVAPEKAHDDPDGEWRALGYSNWVLDQRFGTRWRSYLVHEPKSITTPLLREFQQVFPEELTATAQARFRGKDREVHPNFLYTHYVIEKQREALLLAFFSARHDKNQDGLFDREERMTLLGELDATEEVMTIYPPHRTTLESLLELFDIGGLSRPKETSFVFSSADGYAHFEPMLGAPNEWPSWKGEAASEEARPVCIISLKQCFGASFLEEDGEVSVSDTVRRIAFQSPRCGDCLITHLVGRSGSKGLDAFLPPFEPNSTFSRTSVEVFGLTNSYLEADFTFGPSKSALRQRALRLIQRYSYTIGESSSQLFSMKSTVSTRLSLNHMVSNPPAFLALNDDLPAIMSDKNLGSLNEILHNWFRQMMPTSTKWETR